MTAIVQPPTHFSPHTTIIHLSTLPFWQLQPREQLLIFAPHPDDETLATGGVIASALSQLSPDQIRVIVATNGDASRLAAMAATKRPSSRRRLQNLAARRQQESLEALHILGLREEQVQFWGFPDGGLQRIWLRHWGEQPFHSVSTGYQIAVQAYHAPTSSYTAHAILNLTLETLFTLRPTVIFMPHPEDAHPDHRTLAQFILLAVTLYRAMLPTIQCELLAYPMWLQSLPLLKSIRFHNGTLHLPRCFIVNSPEWLCFPLTPEVHRQKARALQCYHSQTVTVRGLLRATARNSYEVFVRLKPSLIDLPPAIPCTKFNHAAP